MPRQPLIALTILTAMMVGCRQEAPPATVRYALCDGAWGKPRVEVVALRRVLICAEKFVASLSDWRATPQVERRGDTVFVDAVVELPIAGGIGMASDALGTEPYRVLYGPVASGSRLRITNRVNGHKPDYTPLLDKTVTIP